MRSTGFSFLLIVGFYYLLLISVEMESHFFSYHSILNQDKQTFNKVL